MGYDCSCNSGIKSDGSSCGICGGNGQIGLTDAAFTQIQNKWKLRGIIWDEILTSLASLETKCDALDTKLDALDTKLDVIENKIDALE